MSGGKKTDKIIRLKEIVLQLEGELAAAKGHNSVLEAWRRAWLASFSNESERSRIQTTMSALTQLWEKVGAEHQTDAVLKLETIKREAALGKSYQNLVRDTNQTAASLRHQIFTLETAQRQLVFERNGANESLHLQSYEMANQKARIEELETAVRGVLAAMESGNIRVGTNEDFDTDQLAAVLGDDHAEI